MQRCIVSVRGLKAPPPAERLERLAPYRKRPGQLHAVDSAGEGDSQLPHSICRDLFSTIQLNGGIGESPLHGACPRLALDRLILETPLS